MDLDPKLKICGRFGFKIAMCPIFMKFCTQNKSNMLIMNIGLETDDLDHKLQTRENLAPTLKLGPINLKFETRNKSNMLIMNIILIIV